MVPEHPFNEMKPNSGNDEVFSKRVCATIFRISATTIRICRSFDMHDDE